MSDTETTIINYSAAPDHESIQKQIVTSKPDQILLVISTRPSRAIDGVQLRLFKRLAFQYHKKFALATRNIALTELANSISIPVFRSVGEAKRKPWQEQTGEQGRSTLPDRQNQPLTALRREKKHLLFPTLRDRTWLERGIGFVTVLLYIFLPLYLFSSAQIEIHLAPTLRSMTFSLNGRTTVLSADIAGNFPVHEEYQILEIDGQAQSSGFLSLPEDFAYGEIEVTNLSDESIDIPAGLIVMTLDTPPAQFATTAAIQMDADAETLSVSIKAVEPGKASNVAAETIQAVVGEFGGVVQVINPQATIGGANRRVTTPTQTDVNKLRETLLQTLQETAQNDFTAQLTESQTLVPDSIIIDEVITEEVVPTPGETADVFNLSLRVRFRALLVDTTDLIWPAEQLLTASLPNNQTLVEDSLEILPVTAPVLEGDTVSWEVFLHQKSLPVLTQQTLKPFAGGTKIALIQWLEDTYSVTQPVTIQTKPINAFWLPPFYERMEQVITP